MLYVWQSRSHPPELPQGSQSRFTSAGTATRVAVKVRRRAPKAVLYGAVDKVSAVVGRDAAVGLAAVEAAVEIKQQRVEMPPL